MQIHRKDLQAVEIQMGPMIDMVFLLLVFFMVTAKPIKQESDVNIGLPGTVTQEETLDIPDEQRISVLANGEVVLNDLTVGQAGDSKLSILIGILKRFKESADANKSEALVTIAPDDSSQHQRIVDVLNACASAGITGVTFAGLSDEEES